MKLRANLSQETESNADMVLRLLSAASRRYYIEAPDAESAILTCPKEGGWPARLGHRFFTSVPVKACYTEIRFFQSLAIGSKFYKRDFGLGE